MEYEQTHAKKYFSLQIRSSRIKTLAKELNELAIITSNQLKLVLLLLRDLTVLFLKKKNFVP